MRRANVRFGKSALAAGAIVCSSLGVAGQAHATLGGDVASVAANEQHLVAAKQVQKLASGELHILQLPSGIVVHEYVSSTGAVYAVTWRGSRMPDLRELLGPYFTQLSQRGSREPSGHHRMSMVGSDLVLRSSGHRGSFVGRAWVPSLLPSGVNVDTSIE